MMRRIILIVGLCAFVATPVLADLTTVATTGGGGYGIWQTGRGGEFTLLPSGWNPLPLYDDSAKSQGVQGTFQSFCIETHEYINANTTYAVVFNNKAINGGIWPNGDPLSVGTAWLYHAFQNGTLSGYDYQNTGVGRHTSAQDLQNAIWYLEDEGGSLTTAYTNKLTTQFGSINNAKLDNNGRFPVAVLNLYTANGSLAQDQLVCVPVPAAVLLGFLGLSAAGVGLRKLS